VRRPSRAGVAFCDEILDLVGDRLLAAAAFPSLEQDWRVSVRQGAAAVRGALLSHANAVPVMIGRRSLGPNGLRLTEQTLGVFRAAGLDANDSADAYFTFLTAAAQLVFVRLGAPARCPGRPQRLRLVV
jgi:hypothetical protein